MNVQTAPASSNAANARSLAMEGHCISPGVDVKMLSELNELAIGNKDAMESTLDALNVDLGDVNA